MKLYIRWYPRVADNHSERPPSTARGRGAANHNSLQSQSSVVSLQSWVLSSQSGHSEPNGSLAKNIWERLVKVEKMLGPESKCDTAWLRRKCQYNSSTSSLFLSLSPSLSLSLTHTHTHTHQFQPFREIKLREIYFYKECVMFIHHSFISTIEQSKL